MKKSISILIIFSLFLLSTSCATLFKGTTEEVNLNSNPVGAEIWIDGKLMGKTPIAFTLESKKTYVIEFRLPGYEPRTVNLTHHIGAGWIILDVLGGLIPVVIDAVTGAWYSFDEKNVNIQLGR
ncbi:MAG: PEGA domain-containing protein [Candidatus Aminicenantaceae bacterium]